MCDLPSGYVYPADGMWNREPLENGHGMCYAVARIENNARGSPRRIPGISVMSCVKITIIGVCSQ
jgi:hypothetical protein